MEKELTLTQIRTQDRDWLGRIKEKGQYKSMCVVIEKMIKVIKNHKMEEEI